MLLISSNQPASAGKETFSSEEFTVADCIQKYGVKNLTTQNRIWDEEELCYVMGPHINLSNKGITTLRTGFSGIPKNVRSIDLSDNPLTEVPEGIFDSFPQLLKAILPQN